MFMVVTEIYEGNNVERWYYGTYNNRDKANEVALNLDYGEDVYFIVIPAEDVELWDVRNVPQ